MAKTASKGWQRCRILKLNKSNKCTVFLLDIGINEHINWMDLRMLDEKWCHQQPFATRCSLVCMTSASPIEHSTPLQKQEYAQILQTHEKFHIFVNRSGTISSDIFLYYELDNVFCCVNAIFPSGSLSTDDDVEVEETIGVKTKNRSRSTMKNRSGSGSVRGAGGGVPTIRAAGSTFVMNERSAKQFKPSVTTDTSMGDERTMNEIESNDPSLSKPVEKPVDDQQRLSKPETAFVRHIDETGTIYVCFEKYKHVLDTIHFDISSLMRQSSEYSSVKKHADGEQSDAIMDWKVGDNCLVHGKFDDFTQWLRGRITYISTSPPVKHGDGPLSHVHLRDVGRTIEIPLNKLKAIADDKIHGVRDLTWQTRLALIKIRQHQCPIAKILKRMSNGFDEIAVSIYGDAQGDQLDIILWGIKRDTHALLPERIEYVNINEELVKNGHAEPEVPSFENINNCIAELTNARVNVQPTNSDSDQFQPNGAATALPAKYMVTDQRMDVDDWLPFEPIERCDFAAFPMHVKEKCVPLVLSILDANRKDVADQIRDMLYKHNEAKALVRCDALDWKKGDACFARFPADGQFYRGSVRRVNFAKNFCMVSKRRTKCVNSIIHPLCHFV